MKKVLILLGATLLLAGCNGQNSNSLENESLPAPTAEIGDWQTYQDDKEGYSIQYPKHWKTFQDTTQFGSGMGFSAGEVIKMPDDYRSVSIVVADISLEDLMKKYEYIDPSYQKAFVLDGINATKLAASTDDGSGQDFIFARQGDKSYIIFYHEGYETNLKMISTFKFLK